MCLQAPSSGDQPTSLVHHTCDDQRNSDVNPSHPGPNAEPQHQGQENQPQVHQQNDPDGYTDREIGDEEQQMRRADQQIQQSIEQLRQTDQHLQQSGHTNQLAIQSLANRRGLSIGSINTTSSPSRAVDRPSHQFDMIQRLEGVRNRPVTVELHRDPELTQLEEELDRMDLEIQRLREQTGMPQPRSPREENHRLNLQSVHLEGSLGGPEEQLHRRLQSAWSPQSELAAPQRRMHGPEPDPSRRRHRRIDIREEELNRLERDLQETDRLLQPIRALAFQAPRIDLEPPGVDPQASIDEPRTPRVDMLRPAAPPTPLPIHRSTPRPDPLRVSSSNTQRNNTVNPQIAQLTRQVDALETQLREARATIARQEQLMDQAFNFAIMEDDRCRRGRQPLQGWEPQTERSRAETRALQAVMDHMNLIEKARRLAAIRAEYPLAEIELPQPQMQRRRPGELEERGEAFLLFGVGSAAPGREILANDPDVRTGPGYVNTAGRREQQMQRENGAKEWVTRTMGRSG